MNRLKCEFKIVENKDSYILLEDLANIYSSMSITNDAENVIEFLNNKLDIANKKIYYVDTDGRVDILCHDNGKFIGFKFAYDNVQGFYNEQHD